MQDRQHRLPGQSAKNRRSHDRLAGRARPFEVFPVTEILRATGPQGVADQIAINVERQNAGIDRKISKFVCQQGIASVSFGAMQHGSVAETGKQLHTATCGLVQIQYRQPRQGLQTGAGGVDLGLIRKTRVPE